MCIWFLKRSFFKLGWSKKTFSTINIYKLFVGGYLIQIDNKTVKTPLMKPLQAPTKPLAMAIAQEWHMQIEEINIHAMPLVWFLICGFWTWWYPYHKILKCTVSSLWNDYFAISNGFFVNLESDFIKWGVSILSQAMNKVSVFPEFIRKWEKTDKFKKQYEYCKTSISVTQEL